MSFREQFHDAEETFDIEVIKENDELFENSLNEARDYTEASQHLRGLGYKLKMETRTRFGTQIDLAKKYPERELKRDLKDFNYEIKDDSIFVKA